MPETFDRERAVTALSEAIAYVDSDYVPHEDYHVWRERVLPELRALAQHLSTAGAEPEAPGATVEEMAQQETFEPFTDEAYGRLDTFATGGPDPDIEQIRTDVFALLCEFDRRAPGAEDGARLDWCFAHGMDDSVCDGSVDLWWATEKDSDAVTVVTHGTSVRDAIDKAMRGEYDE